MHLLSVLTNIGLTKEVKNVLMFSTEWIRAGIKSNRIWSKNTIVNRQRMRKYSNVQILRAKTKPISTAYKNETSPLVLFSVLSCATFTYSVTHAHISMHVHSLVCLLATHNMRLVSFLHSVEICSAFILLYLLIFCILCSSTKLNCFLFLRLTIQILSAGCFVM